MALYKKDQEVVDAWRFRMKHSKGQWYIIEAPPWVNELLFKKTPDGFVYAELAGIEAPKKIGPGNWLVRDQHGGIKILDPDTFLATYEEYEIG